MIDVKYSFTEDSYNYWDGFWERNDGLGAGYSDPDSSSPTLQEYHRILWSKVLPNGEVMELEKGTGSRYLTWKDFRFGSDSIIVSFRYKRYSYMIDEIKKHLEDYRLFYEDYTRKAYTIGGMIIFPKHTNSINQCKGVNKLIADRFDLTLECIRRFYLGIDSPLYSVLKDDKSFFDLFVDFKGYVDYFYLQDMVSSDYENVECWCGDFSFTDDGLPKTVDEYFGFLDKELKFLDKRNNRILKR